MLKLHKADCWEKFQCGKHGCPAYGLHNTSCWLVPRTSCRDEIQGTFSVKIQACMKCEFFTQNAFRDKATTEVTLRTIVDQLAAEYVELDKTKGELALRVRELGALNKMFVQFLEESHGQAAAMREQAPPQGGSQKTPETPSKPV